LVRAPLVPHPDQLVRCTDPRIRTLYQNVTDPENGVQVCVCFKIVLNLVIRSENEKLAKEKETGEKAVETTAKLREEMAKIKVQIYEYIRHTYLVHLSVFLFVSRLFLPNVFLFEFRWNG
jgi:hypothetical protein